MKKNIGFPQFQGSKENIDGWFFEKEGNWYFDICNKIHNGKIVEIGSFEGLSLSYIKDTIITNNNKIYSVEKHCRQRLIENTKKWNIELICKDSYQASLMFHDYFFDLIYIDANHSYAEVKKDIINWMPKLKNTGIIAGHDYDRGWPGVIKAVDEIFQKKFHLNGRNWAVSAKRIIKLM